MSAGGRLGVLRVIWAAMVGAVVVYTLLIFGLMTSGTLDVASLGAGIMHVVGAVVLVYMAAIVFVRRGLVARIGEEGDAETRAMRYRAATIVSLGLMEAGGLAVITMGLLSGQATWVLAGGGAAAGLMFLARPSDEEAGL